MILLKVIITQTDDFGSFYTTIFARFMSGLHYQYLYIGSDLVVCDCLQALYGCIAMRSILQFNILCLHLSPKYYFDGILNWLSNSREKVLFLFSWLFLFILTFIGRNHIHIYFFKSWARTLLSNFYYCFSSYNSTILPMFIVGISYVYLCSHCLYKLLILN